MGLFDSLRGKGGRPVEPTRNERPAVPEGTVVSPDVHRENRIPPNQARTRKWPVLDANGTPSVDMNAWRFRVSGHVEREWAVDWATFRALPATHVLSDFHCVTRWSRLDNLWEGVATRTIADIVGVDPRAKFVLVRGLDSGFTTNLPIEAFLAEDALFAWSHDGEPLPADHGGPLRLVVPRLYAWKSAKWACGVEFLEHDRAGYWENGGYHMNGDPWREERYRWS
jgi:DMSO/TMAO reductase YedYZ molybdopterin-dependent catalytic subunit